MIYNNRKVLKTAEIEKATGLKALTTYKSYYKGLFQENIHYFTVKGYQINEPSQFRNNNFVLWTKEGLEQLKNIMWGERKEKLEKFIEEQFCKEKQNQKRNVGRPTIKAKDVEYVKRTFNIPIDLDKKLKIEAINQEIPTTELLIQILQNYL
ncbi:MAG: hypothetical protein JG776_484 [Caloramator sp.]|jgi:hypothetical protein|uniref:hypothetical protein n=1 Tax=Caloramator sp. TaxID=1871330 RepID=UPI001DA3652A|nr:hypothetical protein [Caloramator sp.]MBZ4662802.1 hypothetical protein [Caloramator sp.]